MIFDQKRADRYLEKQRRDLIKTRLAINAMDEPPLSLAMEYAREVCFFQSKLAEHNLAEKAPLTET